MRYAKKKEGKTIRAWELGVDSDMERQLQSEGVIRWKPDGSCLLFSKEAVNGLGEMAQKGDFFKVDEADSGRYAYPNRRDWFLEHHHPLGNGDYEVIAKPFPIWTKDDPPCEPMDFLLNTGRLRIDPTNPERYFNAVLWNAPLSAAEDAVIVFYSLERDACGALKDVEFNFVDRQFFERDYVICDGAE